MSRVGIHLRSGGDPVGTTPSTPPLYRAVAGRRASTRRRRVAHRRSPATTALVVLLVGLTAGCTAVAPRGAERSSTDQSGPTTKTTQTSPVVKTAAAEAGYKDSAEVVTIGQLVNGRINAPTFPVGEVVTLSGTIERLLRTKSGGLSGLIVEDASSDVVCVRLSGRATAAAAVMPRFVNPGDTVTVWGAWLASAPVTTASGVRSFSAVIGEVFLSDSTTGTSDSVGSST